MASRMLETFEGFGSSGLGFRVRATEFKFRVYNFGFRVLQDLGLEVMWSPGSS